MTKRAHPVSVRGVFSAFAAAVLAASGAAAATYDLNPDAPGGGSVPVLIGAGSSPVYITNTNAGGARPTAAVDSLRVGQRAGLNIGFDAGRAAAGSVALEVAGDALIEGRVRVGAAGGGAPWLPDGPTGYAAGLGVGGAMRVERGGLVQIEGGAPDGADGIERSGVVAGAVDVNGGEIRINPSGELYAAGTGGGPAMTVRNGGRVVVNAGRPPLDEYGMSGGGGDGWQFRGLRIGGGGADIGQAGLLAAGAEGGVAEGADIIVRRGGFLDTADGGMLARSVGRISIDGTYRSGVGGRLTSEGGAIVFGERAKLTLSADRYRQLNASGAAAAGEVIARAGSIGFAPGGVPEIRSGMGFYSLGVSPFGREEGAARSGEDLVVTGVGRAVAGDGSAADREQFRANLAEIWDSPVGTSQAEAMYDLLAAVYPAVEASGGSGAFNRDVLEGLMNGPGAGIPARGVADRGVAELYSGGAQWGANSVAFNTAEQFMAGLDRRVHRIGAELDRAGHYEAVSPEKISPDAANAALFPVPAAVSDALAGGRLWKGGVYAREEADLDYGIAGYVHRPRGFMLGYDRPAGRWTLGGAAAFARGDYDDRAAESDSSRIDSYSAGLFAAYHGDDGFNASAFATLSGLDNQFSDRRGGMAREADFFSHSWAVGGRLGYDMALGGRALVQPSIGLTHVRARSRSHNEFLDGVQAMRVGDVARSGTLVPVDLTLGFDALRDFGRLFRLNAGVGYAYGFGGAPEGTLSYDGLAGAPEVDVAGREPGRHRLNLGLEAVYTTERFDFTARYDYLLRSSQRTHQARTAFGLKF